MGNEQDRANAVINSVKKIHGANTDFKQLATDGASMFYNRPSMVHTAGNPMTASGRKVMQSMEHQYGEKKAKQIFYATANKHKKLGSKWHK